MNCAWCCVKGTFFLTEIALEEHPEKRKAHRLRCALCRSVVAKPIEAGFRWSGHRMHDRLFCEPPRRCRL